MSSGIQKITSFDGVILNSPVIADGKLLIAHEADTPTELVLPTSGGTIPVVNAVTGELDVPSNTTLGRHSKLVYDYRPPTKFTVAAEITGIEYLVQKGDIMLAATSDARIGIFNPTDGWVTIHETWIDENEQPIEIRGLISGFGEFVAWSGNNLLVSEDGSNWEVKHVTGSPNIVDVQRTGELYLVRTGDTNYSLSGSIRDTTNWIEFPISGECWLYRTVQVGKDSVPQVFRVYNGNIMQLVTGETTKTLATSNEVTCVFNWNGSICAMLRWDANARVVTDGVLNPGLGVRIVQILASYDADILLGIDYSGNVYYTDDMKREHEAHVQLSSTFVGRSVPCYDGRFYLPTDEGIMVSNQCLIESCEVGQLSQLLKPETSPDTNLQYIKNIVKYIATKFDMPDSRFDFSDVYHFVGIEPEEESEEEEEIDDGEPQ